MLVLKRWPGQRIAIGSDITITMLEKGRIGIEAPRGLKILREELEDRAPPCDGDGSSRLVAAEVGGRAGSKDFGPEAARTSLDKQRPTPKREAA
jgi:hypothetical protein